MIARGRSDTPELVDVHRFTHAWEKTASLELRHGRTHAIDTYLAHERIAEGDGEAMTDAAHNAWRTDRDAGLMSVLIAETHQDVTVLNGRARRSDPQQDAEPRPRGRAARRHRRRRRGHHHHATEQPRPPHTGRAGLGA